MVLVEGDAANFSVPFPEEWKVSSDERLEDYVKIRTRIVERVRGWQPNTVAIADLEPYALTLRKAQVGLPVILYVPATRPS